MKKIIELFGDFPSIELDNYFLRQLTESDFNEIIEIYSNIETIKYEGKQLNKQKHLLVVF